MVNFALGVKYRAIVEKVISVAVMKVKENEKILSP